jgi:hypothetical protein
LLRQSLHLLFDGAPEGIDLATVRGRLRALPGVVDMRDLQCTRMASRCAVVPVARDGCVEAASRPHAATRRIPRHLRQVKLAAAPAHILRPRRAGSAVHRCEQAQGHEIVKTNVPTGAVGDPAEQAIARVLQAECDAAAAIARAQLDAQQIAERARADARAVGERTERRIRAVAEAFERELATRLGGIEAEAAVISAPHVPRDEELAALHRAVQDLARQLTGATP